MAEGVPDETWQKVWRDWGKTGEGLGRDLGRDWERTRKRLERD